MSTYVGHQTVYAGESKGDRSEELAYTKIQSMQSGTFCLLEVNELDGLIKNQQFSYSISMSFFCHPQSTSTVLDLTRLMLFKT